ncbi:MAG: hypothetical protein ABIP53_02720 [Candidatus Limnocylindrales bacterium]
MGTDTSAIHHAVAHDQPHRDGQKVPSAVPCYLRRESSLSIERAHLLVDVDDVGLELDHQKRSRICMPGKDVDDATLDSDRE